MAKSKLKINKGIIEEAQDILSKSIEGILKSTKIEDVEKYCRIAQKAIDLIKDAQIEILMEKS